MNPVGSRLWGMAGDAPYLMEKEVTPRNGRAIREETLKIAFGGGKKMMSQGLGRGGPFLSGQ